MQMFNADGSEGMMCGNGIRCFVRFGLDGNALDSALNSFDIETALGRAESSPNLGERRDEPRFGQHGSANSRTLAHPPQPAPSGLDRLIDHPLTVGGDEILVSCVSMGNPHAVHFLDTPVEEYQLTVIGPVVERHAMFPDRVNYEIVNVLDRDRIRVRVWERGSGITLACGTGRVRRCGGREAEGPAG